MPPDGDTEEADGDPQLNQFDEILAAGTPPDHWDETYVPSRFRDRGQDACGIRLSLPTITVPRPTIGEIRGLDTVRRDLNEINGIVTNIINAIRAELPRSMDRYLDDLLGPRTPGPGPAPIFPGPGLFTLQLRIAQMVGRIIQKLTTFPPALLPTTPTAPNPQFAPPWGSILIGTARDQEVDVQIFSKMTSTYSFGRGKGTSHGTSSPTITPALALGLDRPWFAKGLLRKDQLTLPVGIPYPMFGVTNHYIAQFGVAGETTAIHGGHVKLEVASHGMNIRVRFNGNYGKLRVLVIPEAPCKVSWGDFEITGPYESDIVALEDARFARAEATRDSTLQTMTTIQNTLVMLGIAATVIPIGGAVVNLLLRRVVLLLEDKKNAFSTALNQANRGQRSRNYTLAERYPERGPVGGAEDDPR